VLVSQLDDELVREVLNIEPVAGRELLALLDEIVAGLTPHQQQYIDEAAAMQIGGETTTRVCRRCNRSLPDVDYVGSASTVCRACARRHRSSLDESIHEISLHVDPPAHSYDDFVSSRLPDIEAVLRDALTIHR
jgi:hypothetical protein